jgi:acyl-CoA synthetase (AMP-forming)/AMP-acid ligase II
MNVAETLLSRGENSAVAVLHKGAALTYAELREEVARLAGGLLARGCEKGDRIGIFSENNPFFVTSYLGIIRAGLVAVPFQTELSAETFARIVSSAGLKGVFVSARFLNRVRPWAGKHGLMIWPEGAEEELGAAPPAAMPGINPARDLASLMFTSGSTGAPKGVMVTHRNIECNTRDIISYLSLSSHDRVMVVLPFHYCFGLSLLHTHLMSGGSLVINNDFKLFPEAMLLEMQQNECTGFAGVPSTYQILLRKSRFRQLSFPKLRWFQQAGGKLPNPCIQEILQAFPQVSYFLMYGQTEATARLSYLPPARLADKLGSIGRGLPSTRLEALKDDGTPVARGSDETGEIVATGENIALGYWNDPVETSKFFRDGRLHTGDIARVDAEGFIFIVERERDMIKSGGNRVGSKEVEDVIAEIPEILEVAVLGAPDDLLGEVIKAFVVPAPGAKITAQDVKVHCRRRLPAFKTPAEVIVLDDMPHGSSGKILKPALKAMIESRRANTAGPELCPQVEDVLVTGQP